jgi:hypothetical protein
MVERSPDADLRTNPHISVAVYNFNMETYDFEHARTCIIVAPSRTLSCNRFVLLENIERSAFRITAEKHIVGNFSFSVLHSEVSLRWMVRFIR